MNLQKRSCFIEKSIERLVSALLMEVSQDWETDRIYVIFDEGQEAYE